MGIVNSTNTATHPSRWEWRHGMRVFFVGLLITVGSLAFGASVLTYWAERQILTTDNWVTLVSPLPKQPVVATALGNTISDQVFQSQLIEQTIQDALPPRAAFLAAPLAAQLKTITTQAAQKLVASDVFQTTWTSANRLAMDRLLATARGQTLPLEAQLNQRFNIDVSAALAQLGTALGSTTAAIPSLQPASKQALAITADLHVRQERLRQLVQTVDTLASVLPWIVVACFLSALALSRQRRQTAIRMGITVIVLMLIELVALRWLRQSVLDQVRNTDNIPAVGYVYDTLVDWLRRMIAVVLGTTAIVTAGLFAAGPAHWAVAARSFIHLDQLRTTRLVVAWRTFRGRVNEWEYYLWLSAAIIVLLALAFVSQVTVQVVVNAALITSGLMALVHIIGTPPTLQSISLPPERATTKFSKKEVI